MTNGKGSTTTSPASTWIDLATDRLKEGLMEVLYEGEAGKRPFNTCWSSDEITKDIERAIEEGAGDAGFQALGQVWLSNRRAADQLRSPRP